MKGGSLMPKPDRSGPTRSRFCSATMPAPPPMRFAPASTEFRSTPPTAISSINSCATRRICATMIMADRSPTGCGCFARSPRPWLRRSAPAGPRSGCLPTAIPRASTTASHIFSSRRRPRRSTRSASPSSSFANPVLTALSARPVHPLIRKAFAGPLVLNSDFRLEQAQSALASGAADAIAFGRTFLANPDLPERLRRNAPLNPDEMATWYSQGPEGYVDYPPLADAG